MLTRKDKYFFSLNPSLYSGARHSIFVLAENITRLVFPASFHTSGKKNQVIGKAKSRKLLKDNNVVLFPFKSMLLAPFFLIRQILGNTKQFGYQCFKRHQGSTFEIQNRYLKPRKMTDQHSSPGTQQAVRKLKKHEKSIQKCLIATT